MCVFTQSLLVCADKTKDLGGNNCVAAAQNALRCDNCSHLCDPFSAKGNQPSRPPALLVFDWVRGGDKSKTKKLNKAVS